MTDYERALDLLGLDNNDVVILRRALDDLGRKNCCGNVNTRARELLGIFRVPRAKPERHADNLREGLKWA